jgi:hypothetical protein
MDKTKITKEEFFNLDNGIVQDITQKFIYPHILRNQSSLIYDLDKLEVDGFLYEDIDNLYMTDEEIIKWHLDDIEIEGKEITAEDLDDFRYDNPKEIYEWYLVSDWFIDRLREINEPVLDNNYGEYWGRCCTGQAICLDYSIQELAYEYSHDERLYKNAEVA